MAYNGWKNYETWNVALWLDNDQGTQTEMADLAYRYRDEPSELAKAIEDFVDEMRPDLGASMFADLLGAALDEVDWHEIAEHYLADLEEEEPAESKEQ
jgi:hypothetical protein